ncbi:glycosyltransferase family 1 protein [Neobacillus cucumis]|uniref:glycosyltransferase family 1 protein n=1 Tax=Neobacillus cucumis TaxID=1740721 RepID=UPI001963577A|nr:glycosyltransferase family 1 protein [Neobacillus cucumis]MBM7651864.1 glycosyltransferase involved in cell wall biosynthesis [Neobacillus cucumis]
MGGPLRILHVVVNMNRGGAETLIMNLYRNIDKTKVQFDFLTCKEGVFDSEILRMGGKVYRIPYITDVGHFKYIKELKGFFKENKHYKIVHSHMDKMSGFVLREAKKAGIPIRISHSHNTSSEGGIISKIYKWYAGNYILTTATDLFACSDYAAKWLFKMKSSEAKIIKNGIESGQFIYSMKSRNKIRQELNIDEDKFVLGHVGRFNHQKNHNFLIDIFTKFNEVNNESVLLLIGDGPLRSTIEKKVIQLNIQDKVKFIGIRNDINQILQGLDVFVFPSLHEGLPVSLIEAQGAGLPCFISENISKEVDLGGNLVHFLPLDKEDQWLKKIVEIDSTKPSRKLMSTVLKEQGYDIEDTVEIIVKYYLSKSG